MKPRSKAYTLLIPIALVAVTAYAYSLHDDAQKRLEEVLLARNRDGVTIATSSGITVITDLEYVRGGAIYIAHLPSPVTIFDSGSTQMTGESIKALNWQDLSGNEASPPDSSSILKCVYYRAKVSR